MTKSSNAMSQSFGISSHHMDILFEFIVALTD